MKNFYKSSTNHAFHLSVGAVLFNKEKQICCHYFEKFTTKDCLTSLEDFYILMRETLELGETPEQAVLRGLSEEFGSTGKIINYLGSIKSQFNRKETLIEKTTLYFLVSLEEFNLSSRLKDEEEKMSKIQWQTIDFLKLKMIEQSKKYKRTDLDESLILDRARDLI